MLSRPSRPFPKLRIGTMSRYLSKVPLCFSSTTIHHIIVVRAQLQRYIRGFRFMRRLTSITVLLYFLLTPGATILAALDGSIPPCCRGNGEHHCQRRSLHDSGTQISPTNSCPYRLGQNAVVRSLFVPEQSHIAPALDIKNGSLPEYSGVLLRILLRIAADRGPPLLPS